MRHTPNLEKILVFDGAMGTMLLEQGLKPETCPDYLNILEPQQVEEIHLAYLKAGADVITTNTFGGNRWKLAEYGLEDKVKEINREGVKIARRAAEAFNGYVVASVGPTGQFIKPIGKKTFQEIYEVFREQIGALAEEEPDFILLETFHDLGEIRCALLAARDVCSTPVICSLTYEGRRTLTGVSPGSAAVVLEALGAWAVGANCSGGPEELFHVIKEISQNTSLPVLVQPNAGLPEFNQGAVTYPLGPQGFVCALEPYFDLGIQLVGSCCGSTPGHTGEIKKRVNGVSLPMPKDVRKSALASREKVVYLGKDELPRVIGERINPTARKILGESLKQEQYGIIQHEAEVQVEAGAHLLDINVGVHGIDQRETMAKLIHLLQQKIDVPLVIDSTDPNVIKNALEAYHGKALVNSINGEERCLELILPVIKRYGAGVVALTLDEHGIPVKAEDRYVIAEKIVKACDAYGISRNDIYVDCLVLTVGTDEKAPIETLRALKMVKEKLHVNTILGVSNVSHGLPERSKINATFLAMAIANGLDLAIINPLDKAMMDSWQAASLLAGRDTKATNYIQLNHGNKQGIKGDHQATQEKYFEKSTLEGVRNLIVKGSMDVLRVVDDLLLHETKAFEIINDGLIPGLKVVGDKFKSGEFYLPQLMLSAEVAEKVFVHLEKSLGNDGYMERKGTVIIGTVKGDVHDIGKNVVAVILKNHGYHVVDLGKNVSPEAFIQAAKGEKADFIGLSALMTTTMTEIPKTIACIKAALPNVKIIVGGAVVTDQFAQESGADGYSEDAVGAVRVIEDLKTRGK
ncbi:5-methyltetrahydrofolate--homocysteine methyltransferase [Anaerosolibacter carboniphilus]|uniref:Methionine synthase n=1 Tax=Anaerosolibacter carboniphilus TaxID=1417629 RepID=A0A841KY70_9FIRM|nr:homocysteine S-methyltransferase family protein [Anaerosolibacter carboniphilus]MBB6216930.1 5-methyltetrahydrofolate--homocysteine methyltransferase [Anaerosolibacter carboniphilus]